MIKLTVNGTEHSLDVEADTPLLWVVRDYLDLKGSKFGCGAGLCGACTMHLNGNPIRTCITPISSVAGQSITTIEGLGHKDSMSSVQQAWVEHNVPQCGYCQSGQIMSATALLATNAKPSDEDIDSAMSGNICRCGTYPRIKAAIHSVANSNATSNTELFTNIMEAK
ncbi:MAG: isoquinoline 1-oxidoreductase alpha subunit [Oleispira sp.]|jgi:isoquinoline 1-oxidoreductase alpha subunit|tara:strand:+ start:7351 stop:7851 length:501 start_codon:yes stop_codon:yes gene_type:complete